MNILYTLFYRKARISLLIFCVCTESVFAQEKNDIINVEALYVGDFFRNIYGGIQTGQTYLGLMDFGISFNTEDIGLWKNGGFSVLIENTHGGSPSAKYLGDLQVTSNIENGNYTYLYELWYMHHIANLSIKLGIIDLNADAHVSPAGGMFLNSSFGIMPSTSLNMPAPIFPVCAPGVQVSYALSENLSLIAGIWDGEPGVLESNSYNIEWSLRKEQGFLYLVEPKLNIGSGTIKLGLLHHSGEFTNINDTILKTNGNTQLHCIADYTVFDVPEGNKGKTDAFIQLGYLPSSEINTYPFYFGTGINISGLLTKAADDILGIGIAHTMLNKKVNSNNPDLTSGETTIEVCYAIPVGRNIVLQPDIQYIINPSASTDQDNAVAGLMRIYISPG